MGLLDGLRQKPGAGALLEDAMADAQTKPNVTVTLGHTVAASTQRFSKKVRRRVSRTKQNSHLYMHEQNTGTLKNKIK